MQVYNTGMLFFSVPLKHFLQTSKLITAPISLLSSGEFDRHCKPNMSYVMYHKRISKLFLMEVSFLFTFSIQGCSENNNFKTVCSTRLELHLPLRCSSLHWNFERLI